MEEIGPEELSRRFKLMDKYKIEHTLLVIFAAMSCDGHVNETEIAFMSSLLDKVNISQEAFLEKAKKAAGALNYFKW